MHPVVLKSSQLILSGDIVGAERTLVAVADQHGDHALVSLMDDLPPKDLLAIMREFDSSKESIVNMLVTPEQFAHSIVLERQYGERTSERLRAMVNAVIHRDENTVGEYLDVLVNTEGGINTLADYFEDRYDEVLSFATSGRFAPEYEQDAGIQVHTTWLMEKLEELDESLGFGNHIEDSRPLLQRAEVADGDWMETAWLLRYEFPDAFEELMGVLRARVAKHVEALNAMLLAAEAGEPSGDEEESAI
ncbi:MAG: hypothetical protein Q8K57_17435 [Thiobacillus sp.]|nr:hypothetical protein [Thiobacillus sp.]MDP3126729.1 hypothetical protein [Thiobacillus sp.]